MGACPAAPDEGYRGAGLLLATRHHWGRGLSGPPVHPPPPLNPPILPPPPSPRPLRSSANPTSLPLARVIIYRAPSAPLPTLHHLGRGGGGGFGWTPPPPAPPKKSRAVGHCPRVLRCSCARVSLSTSSPGVLRKRVLGWKEWTCGAQGCDVKPPQPLLPWQSVGCAVVRCGGGCAVRVGLGLYVGGGEGGEG